jgi:hypothetical protein
MELIEAKGQLVAIFLRGAHSAKRTSFLTPHREPFQLGIGVFKKGSEVEPHFHASLPATIHEFQEFILVRTGHVISSLYDADGDPLKELEMQTGDALLLLRGAHGFRFLEDTELLEIKQGPYMGRDQMKKRLSHFKASHEKQIVPPMQTSP